MRAVSLLIENPQGNVAENESRASGVTRAQLLFPRGFSSKREIARSLCEGHTELAFMSFMACAFISFSGILVMRHVE